MIQEDESQKIVGPTASASAKGSFEIYPADKVGNIIGKTELPIDTSDLNKDEATEIYFVPRDGAPLPFPQDQVELQQNIEKVLRAIQLIYLRPTADLDARRSKEQFRIYYARLFRLAQVALEEKSISPDMSKGVLAAITADLVDDEASRVKNGHLKQLGMTASLLALPFMLVYFVMRLISPTGDSLNFFHSIGIEPHGFASFMLLLVGCFIGVWLSYGIRTPTFTLTDLTVTDSDRLLPAMRMLFAGTLTMILGLIFMLGVVKVSLGSIPLTDVSTYPALAFLIGVFCGISELVLPTTVSKQATDFINKIK